MEKIDTHSVIDLLIEYFETGTKETDAVAKLILQSSSEYNTSWQDEIKRIQAGTEWTGLRSVEAEIITFSLKEIQNRG